MNSGKSGVGGVSHGDRIAQMYCSRNPVYGFFPPGGRGCRGPHRSEPLHATAWKTVAQ